MSSNNFKLKSYIKGHTKKGIQLLDGRIIFCSCKHIYIYKSNLSYISYDIDIDDCNDIIQLKDGNIIISGTRIVGYRYKTNYINILYVIEIKKNNIEIIHYSEHSDPINKILVLSNGKIVTCSFHEIQIYNYNENKKLIPYFCIKTFYFALSINKCKQNEIVVSCFEKNYFLAFYEYNFSNINFFQLNTIIRLNRAFRGQTFEKLNKNILVVGDLDKVIFINLKNHYIKSTIKVEGFISIFLKLNNNILLGGDQHGNLYQWNINNNNIIKNIKKDCICYGNIYHISKYNNNGFLTCGDDSKIKIWINEDKEENN